MMDNNMHMPWRVNVFGEDCVVVRNDGIMVETFYGIKGQEHARRIVACVNACAGIDIDVLEIIGKGVESELWIRERAVLFKKQRDQLRAVCAEAYQLAGAFDAPVEALDNLSAAANGEPLPHATFLPVVVPDVVKQRDQLMAALKWLHRGEGDPVDVESAISAIEQYKEGGLA